MTHEQPPKKEKLMTTLKKNLSYLILLLCFILVNKQVQAQTNQAPVDTTLFKDLQFRQVGPLRGGRVATVEGIEGAPQSFYMGTAVGAGVWRTDNYGMTWYNISEGKGFKTTAIGAIAVAASDTGTVYVGTGPCGIRDIVLTGTGMYRSTDSGKHWQFIGLGEAGQICDIKIDPRDPNRVFVAALGHAFGDNAMRGIFRSNDGGENWEKVLFASDSTGGVDLEFKPGNPEVMYAALWRAERKPWTIISGADTEDGLYKSTDGGDHWEMLTNGLPTGLVGRIGIAVTPDDPNRVYALVEAGGDSTGLYRSDDAGQSWKKVHDDDSIMNRPFYFTDITADPNDANTVYVGNVSFSKSTDGGKKFKRIRVPHGDTHDLWINPKNSNIQVLATDGGATVTVDGGETWSTLLNQPTGELWQLNIDNRFPYWLYAGQQDRTSIVVPSLPPYPSPTGPNNYLRTMGGCESGPLVPAPNSPIVYANCKGRFGKYNRLTGQEQNYYIGARYMYGHNTADLKFRFMRSAPIEIDPKNPATVYMGSQYVHKTTNGGETWTKISPDVTAFNPKYQMVSGGPITRDATGAENFSSLNSIQVSPLNSNIIWTGSNDGVVYLSKDNGQTWVNVTPDNLLQNARIEGVEPSPHNEGKAYIAVRRRYMDDFRPYIYRTTDFGEHWELLTEGGNGIPDWVSSRVVREDPVQEGLLYVGTDWGLFISFDDGKHWQAFEQGLPTTAISDIRVQNNDLILSTLGRGFVILDNLSVLRQVEEVNQNENHLFKPIMAYRMRSRGSRGVPQYPGTGAYIDFYISGETNSPIVLKITDGDGNIVNTYIGKFKAKENEEKQQCIPESLAESVAPTATCFEIHKGHNRYQWNLRYPGRVVKAVEGDDYFGPFRGPLVVPGDYTIHISRGNWNNSQPLTVKMDPRVKKSGVTLGDLKAQLELNLKIRDMIGLANKITADVDSMRAEVKSKLEKENGNQDDLQNQLKALNKLYRQFVTNNDIAYPPGQFNSQSGYLYRMSSGADQRPGNFAYKQYDQLRKELIKLETRWKSLKE